MLAPNNDISIKLNVEHKETTNIQSPQNGKGQSGLAVFTISFEMLGYAVS